MIGGGAWVDLTRSRLRVCRRAEHFHRRTISGTPSVNGTFNYTLRQGFGGHNTGTVNCSVTVAPPVSATCVSINALQGWLITPATMIGQRRTEPIYFHGHGLPAGSPFPPAARFGNGHGERDVQLHGHGQGFGGQHGTVNCSVTVAPPGECTCGRLTPFRVWPSRRHDDWRRAGGVDLTPHGRRSAGWDLHLQQRPRFGQPTVSGTFSYTVTVKDSAATRAR